MMSEAAASSAAAGKAQRQRPKKDLGDFTMDAQTRDPSGRDMVTIGDARMPKRVSVRGSGPMERPLGVPGRP